jgi:Domain of unknown function (DUF6468)
MNHALAMMIETFVALLLLLTIGYCMLLNNRLKRLKADEDSLKATISELMTATEIAERAIGGLKLTVRDCDENLGNRLVAATDLTTELDKRLRAGDELLRRLSLIVQAARPSDEVLDAPAPPARSIMAAAQAFSERRRAAGLAA